MSDEPAVFIHLHPTDGELEMAFLEMEAHDTLQFLPDHMRELDGWMDAMHTSSFAPVLIEVDGRFPALIYLTDYRDMGKICRAHFAAHAKYKRTVVFRACLLALDMILRSKEVDVLETCVDENNLRAVNMSNAMAFREVVRAGGCVHSMKTNKGDFYGESKSTKSTKT